MKHPNWYLRSVSMPSNLPGWDPWSELYEKRLEEIRKAKAEMTFNNEEGPSSKSRRAAGNYRKEIQKLQGRS